jgi:hypothetical protein
MREFPEEYKIKVHNQDELRLVFEKFDFKPREHLTNEAFVEDRWGYPDTICFEGDQFLGWTGVFNCKTFESLQEFIDYMEEDEEKGFKKGDYIVCLEQYCDETIGHKRNYVFRQREDANGVIKGEVDTLGRITNGRTTDNWRYATPEEIAEYERRGKPYDVTELDNKPSEEELLEEAKRRYPAGTQYKCVSAGSTYESEIDPVWYTGSGYSKGEAIHVGHGRGLIYSKGKWAEIVEKPEQNKKEVIHIREEWMWDVVMKRLEEKGWKWMSGNYPTKTDISSWDEYKENSAVRYENNFGKGDIDYYRRDEYSILSFEDFCSREGISSLQPTSDVEINTYGLSVGDELPVKVLDEWTERGDNALLVSWVDGKVGSWEKESGWDFDRKINGFEVFHGVVGFKLSDTTTWYCRAEGFKEFMEAQQKPEEKDDSLPFNVGDRVEHKKYGSGTVIGYPDSKDSVCVEFDEYISGHNGDNSYGFSGKDGHCWYCSFPDIKRISRTPEDAGREIESVCVDRGIGSDGVSGTIEIKLEKERPFKAGDKYVVIDNGHSDKHRFDIGTVVFTKVDGGDFDGNRLHVSSEAGSTHWVLPTDIELYVEKKGKESTQKIYSSPEILRLPVKTKKKIIRKIY